MHASHSVAEGVRALTPSQTALPSDFLPLWNSTSAKNWGDQRDNGDVRTVLPGLARNIAVTALMFMLC